MATKRKVLWVVNYDNLTTFVNQAALAGATDVAIRTDNDVAAAIPIFHAKGIKVFGWRWPSAREDAAMKEAHKVVGLLARGLDGYYVDPEGEPGKPYDWDRPNLSGLANQFCQTITAAAPNKPFGTTSHYRGKARHKDLPWAAFFNHSTVLLPQAYWRTSGGVIGHGDPADNYRRSIDFWVSTGGKRASIVPMAGELASVTPTEIKAYGAEATAQGVNELHFYTAEDNVKAGVWAAIKAL